LHIILHKSKFSAYNFHFFPKYLDLLILQVMTRLSAMADNVAYFLPFCHLAHPLFHFWWILVLVYGLPFTVEY